MNEVIKNIKPKTIEDLSKISRLEIHEYVSDYLYEEYGITDASLQHLIAILAIEIEHYAICQKNIKEEGLVVFHNGGKTQGANPHLTILNSSTKTIMRIMRELGMTPKSRLPRKNFPKPPSPSLTKFLEGVKK
jgi:P27 family predicted phage terminase small subunit